MVVQFANVTLVTVTQTKHIPRFIKIFCLFPQLAGTGVLAVGLWLRFDERTKGLFTGEASPSVFLTGEIWSGFLGYRSSVVINLSVNQ